MSRFHVCKKVKSFLLLALSVAILVCSVPSFSLRSYALEAGAGYLGSLAVSEYMALVSYLLSRGYSAPRLYSEDGEYLVQNDGITGKAQSILNSFSDSITASDSALGSRILRALDNAARSGKLALSAEEDAFLRSYFDSLIVDSSLVVGTTTETFEPIEAGTISNFSYDFYRKQSPTLLEHAYYSITCDYDALPVIDYRFQANSSLISTIYIYFLPLEPITTSANSLVHVTTTEGSLIDGYTTSVAFGNYDNVGVVYFDFSWIWGYGHAASNFNLPSFLSGVALATTFLQSVLAYFRQYGHYDSSVAYQSTQVFDTSNTDVLTPANTIDENTGDVLGGYTLYIPDLTSLQDTINDFTNGVISWYTAISQLGFASVSDSATVQEKENALTNVVIPDSTYKWITETTWGSETVNQTVTNELVDAQAQEGSIAEDIAEQYSNSPEGPQEDDAKKGGLAMLIATALLYLGLWDDPSTDPTDPDSGGIAGDPDDEETVPWIVDTLTAIPEVSGILGDMFSAAGGTNGYGFVYTVGISFVLFSVIIGAGHFFGALGSEIESRQMAKGAASVADQGKYNNLRSSGRHRHKRVEKGA